MWRVVIDPINLNRARKARAKAAGEKVAAENRARFGRSKAVKAIDAAAALKTKTLLDQAKRER